MSDMDLKYSRKDRLIHYLTGILSKADAANVYHRLDALPDYVCQTIDKAIYEELEFEGLLS